MADYEPEGLDVLMRLYYPTHERPPARWRRPLWVPTLAYSHGMMHFLFDFGDPKRSWWQRLLARAAYIGGHVATTLFDTLPVKENAVPRSEKTMPVVIFPTVWPVPGTCTPRCARPSPRRAFLSPRWSTGTECVLCVENRRRGRR